MGWYIAGGILALILFLLLCRIRLIFFYGEIITLDIRYLFLRFRLLPEKKNSSPKKTEKKKQKSKAAVRRREERRVKKTVDVVFDELMEKVSDFMALLRNLFFGVDRLLRHITIDRVCIQIRAGGEDPAQAGINFGKTSVLVYTLLAALQNYLNIKVQKLHLIPEMFEDVLEAEVSLRVCIPVYVAVWAAHGAIVKMIARQIKKQTEKKSQANPPQGVL